MQTDGGPQETRSAEDGIFGFDDSWNSVSESIEEFIVDLGWTGATLSLMHQGVAIYGRTLGDSGIYKLYHTLDALNRRRRRAHR